MDISKYSKVTELKKNDKSETYLVFSKDEGQFIIIKRINGVNVTELFDKVKEIENSHLTRILDVEFDGEDTIIYEEYIEGETLDKVIEEYSDNKKSSGEYISYVRDLLNAVELLHKQEPSIIHRDIKPENIIISKDGKLKLMDFDAAREYKLGSDTDTVLLGTRGYVAPEQYGFSQTDTRSDIYSIGVVMKDMLKAFDLSDLSKKAKKQLEEIISKCCMFAPDDRYSDVNALRADLLLVFPTAISKKIRRKITAIKILLVVMIGCVIATITCGIISLTSYYKSNEAYLPNFPDAFVVKTDATSGVELIFDSSNPRDVFVINKYFDSPSFGLSIYSDSGVDQMIVYEDMYAYDDYIGIRKEFLETLEPGTYTAIYEMFDYDYVAIYDLIVK